QMNDPTLAIAEDLDLDVAGPLEVAFEIDLPATEERSRLVLRDRQRSRELAAVMGDFHAAPAAAGGGFDQDRVTDRLGSVLGGRKIAHPARRTRDRRNAELSDGLFCRDLVAHQPDVRSRGADEREPVFLDRGGEIGILRQAAETRMDRIGTGDRRRRAYRRHVQIAVARGWRA